ncbi:MAG: hypothetical protein M1815_001921 [Lichina confinis]|nr:MAG: hypothetical protein M1815_001921 [Lichina confinis]
MQISLTISILCLTMFLLGFVADPIINLYVDPYNTILSAPYSRLGGSIDPRRAFEAADDELTTWTEHFLKGLASLGLLSFVKVLFAMSPWQWWNLRSSGLMGGGSGGRAGASGRDRLASISWIVVLVGVGTFIWVCRWSTILGCGCSRIFIQETEVLEAVDDNVATTDLSLQGVYKGVRAWSRRWLEKAGERVIDVQMETDDDDDDDDDADNDNDIHADDGPHFSPCSSAANPAMSSPNEGRKAQ